MDFVDMVQKLQIIYGDELVLVSSGAFYMTFGLPAVILNQELELSILCAKRNICKVAFPKTALYKYIKKMQILNYSFLILDYENEKNILTKKYENKCKNKTKIEASKYEETLNKYLELEIKG